MSGEEYSETHRHDPLHQRQNSLTQSDIETITAIFESIQDARDRNHREHMASCRFGSITQEEMTETVKFCKNANEMISDTKSTARRFLIVAVMTLLLGFAVAGFWARTLEKVKSFLGG